MNQRFKPRKWHFKIVDVPDIHVRNIKSLPNIEKAFALAPVEVPALSPL